MPMNWIDLRSDTVTRPPPPMREAMCARRGRRRRLRRGSDGQCAAAAAGRRPRASRPGCSCPAARSPTCSALMAHCQRGDEYLVGMDAHTYKYEGGGAAVLGSIQPQPIVQAADGTLPLDAVERAIKPDDPHFARTRLLCLENTWHGRALPLDYLAAGARAVRPARPGAAPGRRAPVQRRGRAGRAGARDRAAFRQRVGVPVEGPGCAGRFGAARHAGADRRARGAGARSPAAACARPASSPRPGLYALDHHVARLADDHARAARAGRRRCAGCRASR